MTGPLPAPRTVEVPGDPGPGRLLVDAAADPSLVLLLGHGAGGGADVPDLVALARGLPGRGITVVRHLQPWRVAGRRIAGSPASLDRAWLAAVDVVRGEFPGIPLATGGHSAGARVACRTAVPTGTRAVLALSFPLHPPGRPASSRLGDLLVARVPVMVVQGERDPFGSGAEIRAALAQAPPGATIRVVDVPGAPHDLVPRAEPGWWAAAAGAIGSWLLSPADAGPAAGRAAPGSSPDARGIASPADSLTPT